MSALRLIGPLALSGVILAEWLATGDGLGTLVVTAQARLDMVLSCTAALIVVILSCLATLALSWLAHLPERQRTSGVVSTGAAESPESTVVSPTSSVPGWTPGEAGSADSRPARR